jgi:competence protein ComEC
MQNNCNRYNGSHLVQEFKRKNPLVLIVVTFAAGILAARIFIPYPLSLYLICPFIPGLLLIGRCPGLKKYSTLWILIGLLIAGMLRLHLAARLVPLDHVCNRDPARIEWIQGMIQEAHISRLRHDRYLLKVGRIREAGRILESCGKILFQPADSGRRYRYGQEVRIHGRPERPPARRNPGQFDYRAYLADQDIHLLYRYDRIDSIQNLGEGKKNQFIYQAIEPLRDYCASRFDRYLDPATAGLLNALITGEKQDLEQEIVNRFKQLGVIHVLAISGLHVGYIILFVFTLFSVLRLPRKFKILGLGCVLILYVILVRFISPVLRAALMSFLVLAGEVTERKISIYNIMAGAALLILIWEPRELFQAGFQFSFLGVISLVYGHDKMERILPLQRILKQIVPHGRFSGYFLRWVWKPLQVSLAAVLINLPLTMYYYGAIPTYAVLANLIVIPLVGLIVLLGIFLLIAAGLNNWLATGIGGGINLINGILDRIIQGLSSLPCGYIDVPFPAFWLVVVWTMAAFFLLNITDKLCRKLVLLILCVQLGYWFYAVGRPNGPLRVAFLDVGQGDAACLVFPNRTTMLIDAGDATETRDNGLLTVLPFLKTVATAEGLRLRYVVASHPHDDHIAGLCGLLEKIEADTLVTGYYQYSSPVYKRLLSTCRERNVFVRRVKKGEYLYPDPTCRVYILHPDDRYTSMTQQDGATCNNNSLVLKIQYGRNGILLMGDLQVNAEEGILSYADFLECEILKVAHHGAANATSLNLLDHVQPLWAVIPVAARNKFNHPSPHTLLRLQERMIPFSQTSREGAIIFEVGTRQIRKAGGASSVP